MTLRRTSLTSYAASMRDPDPCGHMRLAKRRWHDEGDLVLMADQIARLNWQDRELLNAIGARLYGQRNQQRQRSK